MPNPSRRLLIALMGAFWFSSCASVPPPPPAPAEPATIFLVRHAEKAGEADDSSLTEAGQERAQVLARVLGEAGVGTIYTTQYARNVQTARPVAERLGITPIVIPAADVDGLAAHLLDMAPGQAALVVSHTDKLPLIGKALGVTIPEVAHTEFDRLTVLTLGKGYAQARTLRYGKSSASQ